MREKYESLHVGVLKTLAKSRGIKGLTKMKKQEVIEVMLALDEKEAGEKGGEPSTAAIETPAPASKESAKKASPAEADEEDTDDETAGSVSGQEEQG